MTGPVGVSSSELQLPEAAQEAAQARVAELITELDAAALRAWPGARIPPGTFLVGLCAWCASIIETGDGIEWRHTGPPPPSPAIHDPEPTRTRVPVFKTGVR